MAEVCDNKRCLWKDSTTKYGLELCATCPNNTITQDDQRYTLEYEKLRVTVFEILKNSGIDIKKDGMEIPITDDGYSIFVDVHRISGGGSYGKRYVGVKIGYSESSMGLRITNSISTHLLPEYTDNKWCFDNQDLVKITNWVIEYAKNKAMRNSLQTDEPNNSIESISHLRLEVVSSARNFRDNKIRLTIMPYQGSSTILTGEIEYILNKAREVLGKMAN